MLAACSHGPHPAAQFLTRSCHFLTRPCQFDKALRVQRSHVASRHASTSENRSAISCACTSCTSCTSEVQRQPPSTIAPNTPAPICPAALCWAVAYKLPHLADVAGAFAWPQAPLRQNQVGEHGRQAQGAALGERTGQRGKRGWACGGWWTVSEAADARADRACPRWDGGCFVVRAGGGMVDARARDDRFLNAV